MNDVDADEATPAEVAAYENAPTFEAAQAIINKAIKTRLARERARQQSTPGLAETLERIEQKLDILLERIEP